MERKKGSIWGTISWHSVYWSTEYLFSIVAVFLLFLDILSLIFFLFFASDKPRIKPHNLSSFTICEGRAAKLTCKAGRKMKIVQARYGRSNKRTCKGGPIRTTKCKATKSLAIVRKYCQRKASCVLRANNSVFGDPCFGTYKYLKVKYRCSKWGWWWKTKETKNFLQSKDFLFLPKGPGCPADDLPTGKTLFFLKIAFSWSQVPVSSISFCRKSVLCALLSELSINS